MCGFLNSLPRRRPPGRVPVPPFCPGRLRFNQVPMIGRRDRRGADAACHLDEGADESLMDSAGLLLSFAFQPP